MAVVPNRGGVRAKGQLEAVLHGRVFRMAGTRFIHPESGEEITVPGTEWVNGKQGTWYDYGALFKATMQKRFWFWLKIKIRMVLYNYLKRLNGGPR
ncbi:MAG: hypothetical protein ABIW76_14450 [Fibrobacteria bacterium]